MPRRTRTPTRSLELALATPAVIAMRTARMMAAGTSPNAADRREMSRMVSEKGRAFTESWFAMAARQQQAQLEWWMAFARACWSPFSWVPHNRGNPLAPRTSRALSRRIQRSQAAVLASGLAPLHRIATSNLRRLSRSR